LTSSWLLDPICIKLRLQTLAASHLWTFEKKESSDQSKHLVTHAREDQHWLFSLRAHKDIPRDFRIFAWCTRQDVRNYTNSGRTGSTSASPCAASTRLPAIAALHQLRRAPRLLVTPPHRLYVNLTVRCEYSSSSRSGSTSTMSYAATTSFLGVRLLRLLSRLVN
jgi:hypothetical protein